MSGRGTPQAERRLPARPALAVALLMVLQVAGCAAVSGGDLGLLFFCTAQLGEWGWLGALAFVLTIGFIPFGLASFAFPALRAPAIAVGIAALSGLTAQHILLSDGPYTCDAP